VVFLDHLNIVGQNISSPWSWKDKPPLLSGHRYLQKNWGCLGYKIYCIPTHSNQYCNSSSYYHPSNKHAIRSTLVQPRQHAWWAWVSWSYIQAEHLQQLADL
jgi:hypothetical protein